MTFETYRRRFFRAALSAALLTGAISPLGVSAQSVSGVVEPPSVIVETETPPPTDNAPTSSAPTDAAAPITSDAVSSRQPSPSIEEAGATQVVLGVTVARSVEQIQLPKTGGADVALAVGPFAGLGLLLLGKGLRRRR